MRLRGIALLIIALVALSAAAQPAVRLPDASPAATTGQTIGITDIAIKYHRPAVNKRKIFGGLEPYGKVWRHAMFTCWSRVTGVTCQNRAGHGLFLSRQSWRAW